jgi:hypothetical protein
MHLGLGEPALECVRLHHNHEWFDDEPMPRHVEDFLKTSQSYLHDTPVPELMGYKDIKEEQMFDLGTWGYRDFLELSPTSTWAILRARHLATTHRSRVDGKRFEHELRELLAVIMPVSRTYITTLGNVSFC